MFHAVSRHLSVKITKGQKENLIQNVSEYSGNPAERFCDFP